MRKNIIMAAMVFVMMVLPQFALAADPPLPLSVEGYVYNADGSPVPAGVKVTVVNIGTGMLEETATGQNFPPLPAYANRYSASLGYNPGAGETVQVLAQSGSWFGEASAAADSGKLEINVKLTQQTPPSQPSLSGTIEKLKEEAAASKQTTNATPINTSGGAGTGQQSTSLPNTPSLQLPSIPAEVASTIAYVSVGLIVIALVMLIPLLSRKKKAKSDKEKKRRTYGLGILAIAAGLLLVAGLVALSPQLTAFATGGEGGAWIAAPPSTVSVDGYVYNSSYATGSLTGNGTIVNVTVYFPNGTMRNIEQTWTGKGFPPIPLYYPQYAASVTGELGVDTVNVTATNGTHIGRNSTIAASIVHLNIAITEPLPESVPPRWLNNNSLTPATYSSTFTSQFNVTWVDNTGMSTVLFELNVSGAPANYSPTQSGNVYSFSTVVPAGTFYWKSYGTDVFNNSNVTDSYAFIVGTAANPVDLWLNGNRNQNVTMTYGGSSNATGTTTVGTAALTRDGSPVSNPEVMVLGANTAGYAYKVTSTGNANYSDNSTGLTYYLIVNPVAVTMQLLLNGTNGNQGYLQNNLAEITVTTVPSGLPVSLFSNFSDGVNKLFQSGNSPLVNLTTLNTLGVFNFTGVFAGNQNYTAASATHFATVTGFDTEPPRWVNANSSTQTPTAGSSLVLDANWTDNVALDKAVLSTNETGSFVNYTAFYGSPSSMSGTSFESSFTWLNSSLGAGDVIAWRIYANDTSGNQNVTPINTFTIQPAPPPPPAPAGGGGGGGGAYVPPAKVLYQTTVSPLIERGQPIDLKFNITNPTLSSYDVYAVTSITFSGARVYGSNVTIKVQPGVSTVRTEQVGTHLCSEPAPGLYEVFVEWHLGSNGAIVDTNLVRYGVAECVDGEIILATDKQGYSYNDTAQVSATVKNAGNVPLHAKLELNMSSAAERVVGDFDVDLLVGQSKAFTTSFDLRDMQNGTHTLRAVLFEGRTIYDEKSLAFTVMKMPSIIIVIAPLPIEAILLGLLALLLAYLLTQRKPIRIIKEAELLNGFIKVTVTAINLRPYPFRDVIVEDTMPVKYEPQRIQPKPGRVWLTEGAAKVQWKFDLDATTEEKQGTKSFTYTLRIKDLVKGLPRPHLIFYRWHPDPVKLLKVAEMRKGLVYVTVTAVNKKAFGFQDMIAEDRVPFKYELKSVQPRPYRFRIVEDGRTMRWRFDIDATTYERQGQTRFTYVMRLKKLVNWLPRPILRKYTREELCS
jgi:hypothetical protein